jgi:hypothetical protein
MRKVGFIGRWASPSPPRSRSPMGKQPNPCPYRKLNPGILMVETAQDRPANDIPGPLGAARDRGILVQ